MNLSHGGVESDNLIPEKAVDEGWMQRCCMQETDSHGELICSIAAVHTYPEVRVSPRVPYSAYLRSLRAGYEIKR